ncbi:5934_t:CDS:2 [Entrophospora sp. SA101]|nr:5934_t:CDS:2 [Entrophospora sp. SA101]
MNPFLTHPINRQSLRFRKGITLHVQLSGTTKSNTVEIKEHDNYKPHKTYVEYSNTPGKVSFDGKIPNNQSNLTKSLRGNIRNAVIIENNDFNIIDNGSDNSIGNGIDNNENEEDQNPVLNNDDNITRTLPLQDSQLYQQHNHQMEKNDSSVEGSGTLSKKSSFEKLREGSPVNNNNIQQRPRGARPLDKKTIFIPIRMNNNNVNNVDVGIIVGSKTEQLSGTTKSNTVEIKEHDNYKPHKTYVEYSNTPGKVSFDGKIPNNQSNLTKSLRGNIRNAVIIENNDFNIIDNGSDNSIGNGIDNNENEEDQNPVLNNDDNITRTLPLQDSQLYQQHNHQMEKNDSSVEGSGTLSKKSSFEKLREGSPVNNNNIQQRPRGARPLDKKTIFIPIRMNNNNVNNVDVGIIVGTNNFIVVYPK